MSTQTKRQPAEPEPIQETEWTYLEARPHPWRKQLYVKGHRLRAFDVWAFLGIDRHTPKEAAQNWDLPLEAVEECIHYCESHRELLKAEAAEERRLLEEAGYQIEPPPSRG